MEATGQERLSYCTQPGVRSGQNRQGGRVEGNEGRDVGMEQDRFDTSYQNGLRLPLR
jgi:hypothetical protein